MINDTAKLVTGQSLKVDLEQVRDRLPPALNAQLLINPWGTLVGYKMVDGNQFGLVLKLANGTKSWFFLNELIEEREE